MTSEYDSHSDDGEEIVVSKRKRNVVFDDESEDEATTDVLNQTNKSNSNDAIKIFDNSIKDDRVDDNSIVESSEIETLPKDKVNESDSDDNSMKNDSVSGNEILNNDEDSNHSENSSENSDKKSPKEKKYTFDPSIYDAEESDEENRSKTPEPTVEDERPYDEVQNNHPKSKKSMVKEAKDNSSKQQNKSKKKNPSDNMREIRRESQRMLRESQIILPYHIPKQRTLAEFLNRRKSAPSIPIRTTAEQLIGLSKQIEQLEKESQEFFKSDSSDSDDDSDDKDYVPDNETNSKSAQDNKILINDVDNKTDKDELDENFNKEKVIDNSGVDGEPNGDGSSAKINENVANLLIDVAEILKNEVSDNYLKETGKSYENSLPSTKISTVDNDTQLSELLIHKSDEQPNCDDIIVQDESVLCDKNSLTSKTSVDSTNVVRLGTNSTSHPGKDDESDCEDFTLNLAMPEDGENVEGHGENEKQESFTLDLTMPEDSLNIVEDKEKNNEESSALNLKEDSETIVGDRADLVSKENKSFKLKKIGLLSRIHVDFAEVPTLSKSFGGEINIGSPPRKAGMIDLKERFFKHYAMDRKKKKSKSPVKVSVVRATVDDNGHVEDINKEIISAPSKPDEQWLEEIKEAELPGAKHSKLKAFLESKAKAKWKEDYDKRLKEYKLNEEEMVEGDKADYEHEAILDDEDEEEDMTNSEEEEPEENDVELVDKKRKQSKFVEDEADVSEDEEESDDDDDDGGNKEEEEEEVVQENEDVLLGYNESDGEDDEDSEKRNRRKKKTKKRKTASNEESESESENEEASDSESAAKRKRKLMTSDSEESEEDEESRKRKTKLMSSDNEEASQSMENLAGLCSGKFPTQPVSFSQLEMADADNLLKGFADSSNSQLVGESLPGQSQSRLDRSTEDSEEEEEEEEEDTKRTKISIVDSDSEEEDDGIVLNRSHKKRAKAVEYSDDEDEKTKPATQNDDDEEEVESENSEELVLDEIGNEEVELDYDSEENEVIRDPKAFFEKEAELSESEWGSEDEDEKDLDKFEEEAGDQEVLDEDEVNRELGKIHMQQMLVDDKRDVRILQELLLEDGELHSDGAGRQRQFRWANADSGFVGGDPNTKDSDEEDSDNEEDEENWRKRRHERELFLNKKNERLKELGIDEEDDEDEEDGGGLLGMGRTLVKRLQQTVTSKPPTTVTSRGSAAAVTMNCKFMAKNMRGSFLTSSDQYLSRLAHITTKVGSEGNVNGPKNSRNFVFSIVSPKKDEVKDAVPDETNKTKKRKASEKNTANAKKKIHFSDDKGNEKRKSLLEVLG